MRLSSKLVLKVTVTVLVASLATAAYRASADIQMGWNLGSFPFGGPALYVPLDGKVSPGELMVYSTFGTVNNVVQAALISAMLDRGKKQNSSGGSSAKKMEASQKITSTSEFLQAVAAEAMSKKLVSLEKQSDGSLKLVYSGAKPEFIFVDASYIAANVEPHINVQGDIYIVVYKDAVIDQRRLGKYVKRTGDPTKSALLIVARKQ